MYPFTVDGIIFESSTTLVKLIHKFCHNYKTTILLYGTLDRKKNIDYMLQERDRITAKTT